MVSMACDTNDAKSTEHGSIRGTFGGFPSWGGTLFGVLTIKGIRLLGGRKIRGPPF